MGKSYIDENGDALELDAEWFARSKPSSEIPELADLVRRGRPPLADDARKQRVTMYLDRDLIEALNAKLNAIIAREIGRDDGSFLPMSGLQSWDVRLVIE